MWLQKPPLGVPLDWSNPLNKGLVMHLATNEGHGDHLNDLSMNGNHGTIQNMAFPSTAASGWNPGRAGVGLNFDGTGDYVDCGNQASLNITDELTLCAWIKPKTITTHHQVIDNGYSATGTIGTRVGYITGSFKGYWHDTVSGTTYIQRDTNPTLNDWSHVTFTLGNGYAKMYINSILQADVKAFNGILRGATAPSAIGTLLTSPQFFSGSIDQVRILNRAWTAKEVLEYYINPWSVYLDEDN